MAASDLILPNTDRDKMKALVEQAWLLTEDEIASIEPGKMIYDFFDEARLKNHPLSHRSQFEIDNPDLHLLKLMRNPDFFSYTCYNLFGKPDGSGPLQIMPYQQLALKELWSKQFPMFMASRGGGKSFILAVYALLRATFCPGSKIIIVGSSFRQSKVVFEYMERIWYCSPVFRDLVGASKGARGRENGPRRDIDRCEFIIGDSTVMALPIGDGCLLKSTLITLDDGIQELGNLFTENLEPKESRDIDRGVWNGDKFTQTNASYYNGFSQTKKVTTKLGIEIEGTEKHKLKVYSNGEFTWKPLGELAVGDHLIVDRTERWHEPKVDDITEDEAYALGLMIGDGCWTNEYRLLYATADQELIEGIRKGTGYSFTNKCDKHHFAHYSKSDRASWMEKWGLVYAKSGTKILPRKLLASSKKNVAAALSGLFDTDGHMQSSTAKGGTAVSVSFTTTSEKLVKQVQFALSHFGIIGKISSRLREDKNWARSYVLQMSGVNARLFHERIGFRLERKRINLEFALAQKIRERSMGDNIPGLSDVILKQGNVGRFRECDIRRASESRVFFQKVAEEARNIGHELADTLSSLSCPNLYFDSIEKIEDGYAETFDCEVPENHAYVANGIVSHNSKIRGLRANYTLIDEFASISEEVYAVVIQGFSSVTADPVQNVKDYSRIEVMKRLGVWSEDSQKAFDSKNRGNQSVITGTAYYRFNHFYRYWKDYHEIINSKGDKQKLEKFFKGDIPSGFDWKTYSIIRLPFNKIPKGYMDEQTLVRAKQINHTTHFMMEYGCVFPSDSDGFFKRSAIERCVGKESNQLYFPSGGPVEFTCQLKGSPNRRYVYGIDPASESDNFSLIIIEMWPDHRRVVYCWTTSKSMHRGELKEGTTSDNDFFKFCTRKIRDLMKVFPCERMMIDHGGGGVTLREAFRSGDNLQEGELPILEVEMDEEEEDFSLIQGIRLIEMVKFQKRDWVAEANHGMKKDFENPRMLLLPNTDSVSMGLAIEDDIAAGRVAKVGESVVKLGETMEDCLLNIEELKDELASIVLTSTTTGVEHWDTPERKQPGAKKGRMKKDRYSALLMANMGARQIAFPTTFNFEYQGITGGFAGKIKHDRDEMPYICGPNWFIDGMKATGGFCGTAVGRD